MNTFSFDASLDKAEAVDGRYFISGVASDSSRDLQNDIIAPEAISAMAKSAIGLDLTTSHNHEFTDVIGSITEANDNAGSLVIKAELDADDPQAMRVFKKIQSGRTKVGFSVGGRITATRPAFGKSVNRIISAVQLSHVMVTSKPVNQSTWAVALKKSLDDMPLDKANVSADERKSHATYFENGEGKFPIFNEATAESALDLIGHAPADKQPEIKKRACAILGDSHPACAMNKSHEDSTMENTDIKKAGAKFSQDTKDALAALYAAAGDKRAVEDAVKSLLGDDFASLNLPNVGDGDDDDTATDDPIGVNDDGGASDTDDGVANKSQLSPEAFEELKKAIVAEIRGALPKSEGRGAPATEAKPASFEDALAKASDSDIDDLWAIAVLGKSQND